MVGFFVFVLSGLYDITNVHVTIICFCVLCLSVGMGYVAVCLIGYNACRRSNLRPCCFCLST